MTDTPPDRPAWRPDKPGRLPDRPDFACHPRCATKDDAIRINIALTLPNDADSLSPQAPERDRHALLRDFLGPNASIVTVLKTISDAR